MKLKILRIQKFKKMVKNGNILYQDTYIDVPDRAAGEKLKKYIGPIFLQSLETKMMNL